MPGITAHSKTSKASHPKVLLKTPKKVNSCFFLPSEIRAQAGHRRGVFLIIDHVAMFSLFIFRRPSKTIEEIIQKKFVQTACQFEEVKLNQKKKETPALNPNKSHIHTHTEKIGELWACLQRQGNG